MNAIREAKHLIREVYRGKGNWNRDYARASALIEAELRKDPDNTVLLTCMGALLSDQGRHKQAVTVLKKAVKLGTTDSNAYFNLAVAMLNCGSHRQAMKHFAHAGTLKARSQTWEAYFDPQGH